MSIFCALPLSGPISFLDIRNQFGGPGASCGTGGGTQAFQLPGTYSYIVPAGTSTLAVLIIGAGGGGGGGSVAAAAPGQGGGGGGGGGQALFNPALTVTGGELLTIVVGARGTGGTVGANGGNGGSTALTYGGGILTAIGGQGGLASGAGGASGSGIAGGTVTAITTSSTSTTFHSGGGGGGIGGGGAQGTGIKGGNGGAGTLYTVGACSQTVGGGGGGAAPATGNGQGIGLKGDSGGCGAFVSFDGVQGDVGFGGGGGGGGSGLNFICNYFDTTTTNFTGFISTATNPSRLFVSSVLAGAPITVGTIINTGGTVTPGTTITSNVSGNGSSGTSTWVVSINQSVSTTTFSGTYTAALQAITPISAGLGGNGGSGGVYLYAGGLSSGNNIVPINEYYRGGAFVPCAPVNSNVPTSGAIVIPCDFYGAQKAFVYSYFLPTGAFDNNFCLLARAQAACPPYQNDGITLVANIKICGVLGSNDFNTYAFGTGANWSTPPKINVCIGATGVVTGAGGSAGAVATTAVRGDGGGAMVLDVATCIVNNGIIQGGGGSGYPGGSAYGAGAGYFAGVGVAGNEGCSTPYANGTLFSGGAAQFQRQPAGKKGKSSSLQKSGAGGGWVSSVNGSPSTDGFGRGANGCGVQGGLGKPGVPIKNGFTYARITGSGIIRGLGV
jgi:hypothetical protein